MKLSNIRLTKNILRFNQHPIQANPYNLNKHFLNNNLNLRTHTIPSPIFPLNLYSFSELSDKQKLQYILKQSFNKDNRMQEQSEQNNSVILIRHGQSNFNRGFLNFLKDLNLDISYGWENTLLLPGFGEAVSYSQQYFDSPLTEEGVKQCSKARQQLKSKKVDLVLVSPYQRTLQTCNEIFGGRGIKVEVHPIVAEVFRFSCDIGHEMEHKIKQFPEFDFTHMNDSSQLWFIEHIATHHQQKWNEHLKKHQQPLSYSEKQQIMLELLKEKVIYESAQQLRERMWKCKQILSEYSKKYKTIAIVSHFHIVQCLLAKQFDKDGYVVDQKFINNAEPQYTNIEDLLKTK